MKNNLEALFLAGTLAVAGCSGEPEKLPENFTRYNSYGDQMCTVIDSTGKKVERLCGPKLATTKFYQKWLGTGQGPYSTGGFSSTQNSNLYTLPGAGNTPKSVNCTEITVFNQDDGTPDKPTITCR